MKKYFGKQVKRISELGKKLFTGIILVFVLLAFTGLDSYALEIRNPLENRGYTWESNTWSYVYFGSFPQTEITDTAIIAAIDAELSAKGVAEGDVRIDGIKYRKVNKIRKQYVNQNETAYKYVYENHYYRWERIKWRVLSAADEKVLLMADKALTSLCFSTTANEEVMWSNSRIRGYLNGYGSGQNADGIDYSLKGTNFYTIAFSKYEAEKLIDITVSNKAYTTADNVRFEVGRNEESTTDKVVLLSYEDITNSAYGFGKGTAMGLHENRKVLLSDYVGIDEEAYISSANNGARYWLRNDNSQSAAYYIKDGRIYNSLMSKTMSIVPVIKVSLISNSIIEVTDDQSVDDGKKVIDSNKSSISYVLNGGVNNPLNPTYYFEGTPVTSLYPATRSGYIFMGWFWDSGFTNKANAVLTTSRGNITFYAKWETVPVPDEPRPPLPPQPPQEPDPVKGLEIRSGEGTYVFLSDAHNAITGLELKKWKVQGMVVSIPDKINYKGKAYRVLKVGNNAFKNKKTIKTVVLGKYVSEIGKNAFYGCSKLKNVELNEKLVRIGDYAFYNDKLIETIVIPKNVAYIGKSAFQNCRELLKITFKTTKLTKEESIGKNAFKKIYPNAVALVPAKRLSLYKTILANRGINGAKQSIRKK